MAGVNIREANNTDINGIYKLMMQQVKEENDDFLPTSHLTYEDTEKNISGSSAVAIVFVAVAASEGEIEGYILGHRSYSTWEARTMFIKEIYVSSTLRHSGVAVELCKALLQAALKMGCVRCDIKLHNTNKPNVSLFEKLGAINLTEAEGWNLFSMDSDAMTQMKIKSESQGVPQVRAALPEDMEAVMAMIQELADYEKMSDAPKINAQTLVSDSSPEGTFFECFVVESDGDGLVGYVLPYHTFSRQGRGIYMEDLYVKPTHRCKGLGTTLMARVAQRGLALGATHLEFSVLSWNTPSITFYQQRGAINITADKGIQIYRFDQAAMKKCVKER